MKLKGSRLLFPALLKTLILPPILTYLFILFVSLLPPTPIHIPSFLRFTLVTLLYLISFPLVFIVRTYIALLRSSSSARALGATEIPRVKGRWPLNVDVLLDWAKSGSEEEVGWMIRVMQGTYGQTFNTRVLGEDQIITTDPVVLKHILVDDFSNFVKGAKFKERAEGFLGDGIFNSDGDRWRFHRALTRPFFHPSHVSTDLILPHIHRFLTSLPTHAFDIQARLGNLALDLALAWMCGEGTESKEEVEERRGEQWVMAKKELGGALVEAQRVVGKRVKIGTVWPLFELTHDPLAQPMQTIRTFFAPLIDEATERRGMNDESGQVHLIDRLVDATSDRKLVEDQLINILLASRDTTTSLLTFCVYVLALDPAVRARIDTEVQTVAPLGEVDKDVVRESRIARAFINEVLRLFPPLPLNIRRTLRPSLLPTSGGELMFMPGNTSIIVTTLLAHRSEAVWGPDADKFDLDKWMDDGLTRDQREAFMPWNVGPRMCLGQPLALAIAHTFIIQLSHFLRANGRDLRLAPECQPPGSAMPVSWKDGEGGRARGGRDRVWVVADVVLAIKGGLWVKVL